MASVLVWLTYALFGFIGLANSVYIYKKKTKNEKLVCNMVGDDCSKVVNSKYGETFGIDNTISGAFYFLSIMAYGFVLAFGYLEFLSFYVLMGSGFGFLFSLYLTYIQIFEIKDLCQYCLLSAAASFLIFLIPLFVYLF